MKSKKPKNSMLKKLRKHLSSISTEQFKAEWNKLDNRPPKIVSPKAGDQEVFLCMNEYNGYEACMQTLFKN